MVELCERKKILNSRNERELRVLLHPKGTRHGFCLKNGGKLIRPVVSLLGRVKTLTGTVHSARFG